MLASVSIVLTVLSLITVGWGVAKTAAIAHDLVWERAWQDTTAIAKVVSTLDVFLLATTIFVVGIGVWQLFVSELDVPAWLQFDELRSLKVVVADLLVLTLTVKLVEDFLVGGPRSSFFAEAAGVAVVNLSLLAFATLRSRRS